MTSFETQKQKGIEEFDEFWTKKVGKHTALKDKIDFQLFLSTFADSIRESVLEENNKDWILFIKRQEELGSISKGFSEAIDLLNLKNQKK